MANQVPAYFVLGNFNLNDVIVQDNFAFANAMQQFIIRGSNRDAIPITSIQAITDDANHANPVDIAAAVAHGMRFFDALAYFALPVGSRPTIVLSNQVVPAPDRAPLILATRLFYLAFYLVTRGNVPVTAATTVGPAIPSQLANMYGMTMSPDALCGYLCSFNLRRLNNRWIRYINWAQLDVIPRNRFGLGVAGYRNFAPFKLYNASPIVEGNVPVTLAARDSAFAVAHHIATTAADWSIHPITRDPAVIQTLGPLNGNLNNLMLASFPQVILDAMAADHVINAPPVFNGRFVNFRTWTMQMITFLNDPIVLNPGP